MFQFVKSAKWKVGEEDAFRALGSCTPHRVWAGRSSGTRWARAGAGRARPGTEQDHAAAALEGWREIQRRLAAQTHDLYVLDEFTYPMKWGWVDVDEVVADPAATGRVTSTSSSPAGTPRRRWWRRPTWSPR